jgi:predicted Zn-dependent protease
MRAAAVLAAMIPLAGCLTEMGGDDGTPMASALVAEPFQVDPREVAIAEREHPRILASYGGTYEDPEAEIAIARAVSRLVEASEQPSRSYRVTILNSPAINAFALPGGYVYVTRGLLALASDTSEVAAVIAHEMAHVTARHAFARAERVEAAEVAGRVLDVVSDAGVAEAALASTQSSLARFSQIQELEADTIGINTLARAGYDPYAAARFLRAMARFAAYKTANPSPGEEADFLSSHPSTPERLVRALETAGPLASAEGERDQEGYLRHIDGLMFGDDPVEGFVRGREFLHSKLGLAFRVPEGFRLENTADAVLATDATGIALRFDGADVAAGTDLVTYVTSGWVNGLDESSVRVTSINGLPAATASATARGFTYRIAVIRFGDQTFRFLFAARSASGNLDRTFADTVSSFRALTPDEQVALEPLRIRVVTVGPGDTVESFASRMDGVDNPVALFRVLNGLEDGAQPAVGSSVKIVADS